MKEMFSLSEGYISDQTTVRRSSPFLPIPIRHELVEIFNGQSGLRLTLTSGLIQNRHR